MKSIVCAAVMIGACAGAAQAGLTTLDFDLDGDLMALPAGTILSNQYASVGVTSISTLDANRPAIVFNSSMPTGNDPDLGTPHMNFGGPGVGAGGVVSNNTAFGNIMIIANSTTDTSPMDGLVDNPNDFAGGGTFVLQLAGLFAGVEISFIDIEENGGTVQLLSGGMNVGGGSVNPNGDNGVSTQFYGSSGFDEIRITMVGSGAVGEIELRDIPAPATAAMFGLTALVAGRRRRCH